MTQPWWEDYCNLIVLHGFFFLQAIKKPHWDMILYINNKVDVNYRSLINSSQWNESHSVVLTLCDPMDYTVHGILQARILEWVAFPFSRGSSQPRDQTQVSHIAGGFFTSWALLSLFLSGKGGLVVGRLGWGREKVQLCDKVSPGVVMYWRVYIEGVREEKEEGHGQEKGIWEKSRKMN